MNIKTYMRPVAFTLCTLMLGGGAYYAVTHFIGDVVGGTVTGTTTGIAKSAEVVSDSGKKIYDDWHDRFKVLFHEMDQVVHAVPKITVNGESVFGGSTSVLELTSLEQDMTNSYEWSHEWLKSTKTITIKTKCRVKIGFDLREHFQYNITVPSNGELPSVRVVLPSPKILSVEQLNYSIVGDNGWWNKLTDIDRTNALNEALKRARKTAENDMGLKNEAKMRLQSQCTTTASSARLKIEYFVEATP